MTTKNKNRIVTPGEMVLGSTVCDKVEGTGTDAGGLTQRGSGYEDGIYYHDSVQSTVRIYPSYSLFVRLVAKEEAS